MKVLNFTLLGIFILTQILMIYTEYTLLIYPLILVCIAILTMSLTEQQKKRKLAQFVIKDKFKRLKYGFMLLVFVGGLTYFNLASYFNDPSRLFVLLQIPNVTLMVAIPIIGSGYYTFDNDGIIDNNNKLAYENITKVRISDSEIAFDTPKYINEIVIKKQLIPKGLIDYLYSLELNIDISNSVD